MAAHNLSQLKTQFAQVIQHLQTLEAVITTVDTSATSIPLEKNHDINALTTKTQMLLNQLEAAPLQLLKRKARKRKLDRRNRKTKQRKQHKLIQEINAGERTIQSDVIATTSTAGCISKTEQLLKTVECSHKPLHLQLRSCYDAQRFLRTFELLKMLHFERCKDPQKTRIFAAQLSKMQATWNNILHENMIQTTQQCKIEDQWNELLFGAHEQTYYKTEQKLSELLRIRRSWDSYLTRSKHGTSIPIGWVLPPTEAQAAWLPYQDSSIH